MSAAESAVSLQEFSRLGILAWVVGAVLVQFTLFVVLSEPRVVRASTSPTGGRDLDVDQDRLSCCGRRAGWRPSAKAERIAKARQTEPFLYRSVTKRWLKRVDYLTFIRLYKMLAVVGMAIDFLTDVAVGVELLFWSDFPSHREAHGLEREGQGIRAAGVIIVGLSMADFVSLSIHYAIRGSPSFSQHLWTTTFALLEVPILVLTIMWARKDINLPLFIVSAFVALVAVLFFCVEHLCAAKSRGGREQHTRVRVTVV
ncbi:unnamed protein product [Vitrella brassicaformis CCMP3155]|uniref:Uncharacterized protein n=1 Tax=Vitrella brassicaformis (strain CCMP3155) TaxID=1169540 RepID=A0A0G4GII1_VITBC|nr:unnamed protein product [Vitrella brassicaformis CCMP3155]|eukprot:CEM29400.1 unnamed protein product [Vitrella brassicaformis CCMP3155]